MNPSTALAHLFGSWRSLRGGELICALLVALYLGAESYTHLFKRM